jgi:hypothetical protein
MFTDFFPQKIFRVGSKEPHDQGESKNDYKKFLSVLDSCCNAMSNSLILSLKLIFDSFPTYRFSKKKIFDLKRHCASFEHNHVQRSEKCSFFQSHFPP